MKEKANSRGLCSLCPIELPPLALDGLAVLPGQWPGYLVSLKGAACLGIGRLRLRIVVVAARKPLNFVPLSARNPIQQRRHLDEYGSRLSGVCGVLVYLIARHYPLFQVSTS